MLKSQAMQVCNSIWGVTTWDTRVWGQDLQPPEANGGLRAELPALRWFLQKK